MRNPSATTSPTTSWSSTARWDELYARASSSTDARRAQPQQPDLVKTSTALRKPGPSPRDEHLRRQPIKLNAFGFAEKAREINRAGALSPATWRARTATWPGRSALGSRSSRGGDLDRRGARGVPRAARGLVDAAWTCQHRDDVGPERDAPGDPRDPVALRSPDRRADDAEETGRRSTHRAGVFASSSRVGADVVA